MPTFNLHTPRIGIFNNLVNTLRTNVKKRSEVAVADSTKSMGASDNSYLQFVELDNAGPSFSRMTFDGDGFPSRTADDGDNRAFIDKKEVGEVRTCNPDVSSKIVRSTNNPHLQRCEFVARVAFPKAFRAISFFVTHVLAISPPREIGKRVVKLSQWPVSGNHFVWAWADKGFKNNRVYGSSAISRVIIKPNYVVKPVTGLFELYQFARSIAKHFAIFCDEVVWEVRNLFHVIPKIKVLLSSLAYPDTREGVWQRIQKHKLIFGV